MNDRQYSLEQLENATRVPARQIRELVRLGILPAPSSRGRGATYGSEHLERLRAWKRIRRDAPATTNEQIRGLLDRLQGSGLLRAIGEGTIPFSLVDDRKAAAPFAAAPPAPAPMAMDDRAAVREEVSHPQRINEPALDYLRSIRDASAAPVKLTMPAKSATPQLEVSLSAAERSGAQPQLERLLTALHDFTTTHSANVRVNQPKSETWQRVTVGRDLEIAARGPLAPDEIQLLETVGQLLQQAIYRKEP